MIYNLTIKIYIKYFPLDKGGDLKTLDFSSVSHMFY